MFFEATLVMNFLWGVITGWGATEIYHGVFDDKPNKFVCELSEEEKKELRERPREAGCNQLVHDLIMCETECLPEKTEKKK
jgi:hypothetical protein